jgi:hypothetical protein
MTYGGGGGVVPEKYAALGFKITRFGINSNVLIFDQKPVFVFDRNVNIDDELLAHICDTYLIIIQKRKDLSCIRVD